MLAIEYSTREFFNMLITVQWEWLLATIILTGKLLTSRLARTMERATRNTERATRNSQPVTRNSEQCI